MGKKHRLTNVVVSEVSGVDIPANQHSRVVLMKSAGDAIDGMAAIRKSLEEVGPDALATFDAAIQESGDDLAALIAEADPDMDEDLSRMAHAFGESVARIHEGTEGAEREAMLAETVAQYTAAVANHAAPIVAKAAMPPAFKGKGAGKGRAFKTCDGCPDEGECRDAGKCATESASRKPMAKGHGEPMAKAAGEDAGEDGEGEVEKARDAGDAAILKAATTFAAINGEREQRRQLMDMSYTLQESMSSILGDPDVPNKAGLLRQSVAEFDAAVAVLLDEAGADEAADPEAPGTTADAVAKAAANGGTPTQQGNPMSQEIIKGLQDRVTQMERAERERQAVVKANALLPNGGAVPELAALLAKSSPEDAAALEVVMKSATAHSASSDLFKSFGAAAGSEGDQVVSGVVKQAQELRKSADLRAGRRVN